MSRLPVAVRRLPARVRAEAALEALSDRGRLVLAMRLLEGLSALETAGALSTTVREVERHYREALREVGRSLVAPRSRARQRKAA